MSTIIRKDVDLLKVGNLLVKIGKENVSTQDTNGTAELKKLMAEAVAAAGAKKTRHSGGLKPTELYIVGYHDEIIVNTSKDDSGKEIITSVHSTTVFDFSTTPNGTPMGFFWWKELVSPRASQRPESAGQLIGADGTANIRCQEIDNNFELTNAEKAKATYEALKDKPLSCKAIPFGWNNQGRDMFAYRLDFKE